MTRQEALLVQIMEEASEVSKCASKCLRFGEHHAQFGYERTAAARLIEELIDLWAVVQMGQTEQIVNPWPDNLQERMDTKKAKVEKYLKISQELGRVS